MISPERIGHVVIKVRDLERSRRFYTEVMGLQLMEELRQFKVAFLASNGRDHHEIALIEVGNEAPEPQRGEIGLSHIAFRLRDDAHLRAAYAELKAKGVAILSAVDHGVTRSIYFRDPDGHQLEVYCDHEYVAGASTNNYSGTGKLDFAQGERGLMEALGEMSK